MTLRVYWLILPWLWASRIRQLRTGSMLSVKKMIIIHRNIYYAIGAQRPSKQYLLEHTLW